MKTGQTVASQRASKGCMAYQGGLAAEDRVSSDYERRGLTVAHRRWRGQCGEIDIVTRDGNAVVFVEVKQSRTFDGALAHLTKRQIARLYAAAEEFVGSEPNGALTDIRFDVALVNGNGEFRIMENAFA